jgi:hypothetical protein
MRFVLHLERSAPMPPLTGNEVAVAALQAAAAQWEMAGGHVLVRAGAPAQLCRASLCAFALQQAAGALDAEAEALQQLLCQINGTAGGEAGAPRGARPRGAPPGADDTSDGSPEQAELVARNVRRGKPERRLQPPPRPGAACSDHLGPLPAGCVRAIDGSSRLLWPGLLSESESQLLVAAGVAMMAGAFSRCGQTTLGLSPALAQRVAGSEALAGAVPLLYVAVERARRRVAAASGTPLGSLRLSDATLTRLRPTAAAHAGHAPASVLNAGSGAPAEPCRPLACEAGALDVGEWRGDGFSYSRPHVDKVRPAAAPPPFPPYFFPILALPPSTLFESLSAHFASSRR